MKKSRLLGAVCALLLSILVTPASAVTLVDWGTGASSSTLLCADFSLPSCGVGTSPGDYGPHVDNYQLTSADSSIVSPRGEGEGHSVLSTVSGISMPDLTAYAAGTAGGAGIAGIGFGRAWALEGYTYSGPDVLITLDVTLDGIISNPVGSSFGRIGADIYILDPAEFDPPFGSTDLGGFIGEGFSPLEELHLRLTATGMDSGSFVLDLIDGDQFYVWARLYASAANGGVSDALGTLTTGFSDINGLTAASIVPIPAAAWLFGSGLIGLIGVARRKKA